MRDHVTVAHMTVKMAAPMSATRSFVLASLTITVGCLGQGLRSMQSKPPVPPPVWPDQYTAQGMIRLPYTEIKEPFTAYYDFKNSKSRIDYYGNMMKTYQIGSQPSKGTYGSNIKVVYFSNTTVFNKLACFQVNGTKDNRVTVQTVLPDITFFKKIQSGIEWFNPDLDKMYKNVDVWQNVTLLGQKKNTYTLYVDSSSQLPLRYEMMGYDSLFGSHYDKYLIDYTAVTKEMGFSNSTFQPANLTCGGFPGPGLSLHQHHHVLLNPMREYINHEVSHMDSMFEDFKGKHNKQYTSSDEERGRKNHFVQNVRFIHSKNRAGLSYALKVNHLTDRSHDELKLMRGRLHSKGYNGGQPFYNKYSVHDIPEQLDWRLMGAVTPVKDQAICGSCWSFGTTGTIEGTYFLKTKSLVRLSQQELMDCSWGEGNNACDGGEDFRAYHWIIKNGGIALEDDYGGYLGSDGMCRARNVSNAVQLKGFVNVTSGDLDALKVAVAINGPISVGIDASHLSLSFYANGVYYEPACGNKPDDLDHAVLAVGYGTMDGQAYWLIKNSWSTYWGNDGYVLMSMKKNNCGVATSATYPLL